MTTQTLSYSAPATAPEIPLIKRIGLTALRLLERMTESAYRQHQLRLRTNFYI
ncbi:hypothetical protein [Halomonas kalidii]|uniref:Uncharacterized protein n=1 Tax=Halomonas kalidii TaxID=3043293 RepID=A0ABT6VEH4_9GAMM|nr:hypothetical protein [Halomonas kalidii]MDI5932392.1 hypothetical protein [Halomonas kalidii]